MPRYFAPISKEDLAVKIEAAAKDEYDGGFDAHELVEKLKKDLKVKFDLENFSKSEDDFGPESIMGPRTLPNGLTFHGFCAGGDWEQPVYFIVYFDGKKLRAYVPTKGNPWNTTTKEAYGNDEDDDLADVKKTQPELFEGGEEDWPQSFDEITCEFVEEDILADIIARIQPIGS